MWDTLIVQPIFNLLVFIYAVIPGHDFGIAIILFTIVVRVLMWPLVKKQLHHTRAMRELQPEIKKIKEKTKGDKQKEAQLLMELYKEREINPFSSIGVLLIQLPILIGLFQGLRNLANDPNTIVTKSYDFIHNIGIMPDIVSGAAQFDETFLGFIDLHRRAFENGVVYWPLLVISMLAAIFQFYQSRQLMPDQGDSRSLRQILKDESQGKKADQAEINAAMGRNMKFFFPILTFVFAATFQGALALYWATGSLVAVIQQKYVLNKDVEEMEQQVKVKKTTQQEKKQTTKKKSSSNKKRKR